MANSPEPRRGNDANKGNEQSWENQMAWGREDKGASVQVRQPSSNRGVIHFVRDQKTWESDRQAMTVNFLESGITSIGSSSEMVRYHTKVPVSWGKSATTADSKTATSTYKLKGFPPVKVMTITGTFVSTMLGEGVEPTFSEENVSLRSNSDKQVMSITNKTKKWSTITDGKEGPALNLPDGDFTFELRYNAVRAKYEIYGYDPNELIGPGGDYNRDLFSRYILFETSELTPGGVNKFTPVLETLSGKTFELALFDIQHKIKQYVVPNGLSAEFVDMWHPGGIASDNNVFGECTSPDSITQTANKIKTKAADQKTEADKNFTAYTKAAAADKPAESVAYYEAIKRSLKIKISDNEEAQANAAEAQDIAVTRKAVVEKFKKLCFERNEFKVPEGDPDACHKNCTKYCDDVVRLTAIVDEEASKREKLKNEMKDLKAQYTENEQNLKDRAEWQENHDRSKEEYSESIRNWKATIKAAENLEQIEALILAADGYNIDKNSEGCKE